MYDIMTKIGLKIKFKCKQIYIYVYIKLYDLCVFEVDQSAVLLTFQGFNRP